VKSFPPTPTVCFVWRISNDIYRVVYKNDFMGHDWQDRERAQARIELAAAVVAHLPHQPPTLSSRSVSLSLCLSLLSLSCSRLRRRTQTAATPSSAAISASSAVAMPFSASRKGKIHRVGPDFGSTLTVSSRDYQSKCWVNWKIMGQPCEFQVAVGPS
jgi:hypothetical protein